MDEQIGKIVSDLDIDNDTVLLSTDIPNIAEQAAKKIDINKLSGDVYNAILNTISDDYVLKRMLSTLMFLILSDYNLIAVDCLDGIPNGHGDIDSGGASDGNSNYIDAGGAS